MHLYSLVSLLFLSLGALVKCAAASDWCYSGCYHSPGQWADLGHPCGGKRQSPIDIVTAEVKTDPHLLNFTFVNFSSPRVIKSIVNDGQTVKCVLENNEVEVSEGGLNGTYSALELHFRWGDDEHHPGSEHTVDGHRYPMEMHVVSPKKGFSVQNAANDSEGIAILAFFINANDNEETLGPWSELTAYLTNDNGTVAMNHNISIDDLIGNVDPTKFYRYMGSLTIPDCSESVVWTVFQDPINVHTSLVERFPAKTGLTDVHRTTQALNGRSVFASPAVSPPVKCVLKDDTVEVSGGGLQYNYSTLQFHFHWGSRDTNGSEHKVDSKRYPMEMHIVNKRKDLTLDEALETPNGLAVLGFFIEPKAGDITSSEQTNATSDMEVWRKLTSYVSAVENISSDFMDEISIDDLLGDVNRVEYYRYAGSLTTPSCNEAVAWTVFKESVKVDKDLMMLFPANTNYSSVFRPTQPLHDRIVYTTAAASNAADPADPAAPLLLLLLLTCLCACSRSVRL
uniref:Carbonic anhydrase n=1 Tax=Gasterosteus aculeatus aculeatus TaxID=481459 RepID=A0AAQ4PMX2_GASAC